MDLVRLVLALLTVGLAFSRLRRDAWLGLLTLVVAVVTVGPGLWSYTTTPAVRGWNVFHYYLGAEYYRELGYLDLYPAALAADREGAGAFAGVTRVRNQATYEIETREEADHRFDPKVRFTPERWRDFAADVAELSNHEDERDWQRIFVDRGYNATPFWSSLAKGVTTLLPARQPVTLKLLAALDLILLTLAGLALLSAFGRHGLLAALLLFLLSPVDGARLIGGFLQYDWLAALAFGLAAHRLGRPAAAGVAFGYATLVRVFPVLLVATLLAPALMQSLRSLRTGKLARRGFVLAVTFVLTLGAGFGLGCATPRGVDAWREFAGKIGFHAERHVFGDQRVGLQHLFTSDLGEVSASAAERRASLEAARPVVWAVGGLLLAGAGLALLRRRGTAAALLGLVPFFVATVASRYYWSVLAFLPLGAVGTRAARRALGLTALLFAVFYAARLVGAGRYGSYLVFDAGLLVLAVVAIGGLLRRDLAARRRLRRARG